MAKWDIRVTYTGSTENRLTKTLRYAISAEYIQDAIQEVISQSNTGSDAASWELTGIQARKSIFG